MKETRGEEDIRDGLTERDGEETVKTEHEPEVEATDGRCLESGGPVRTEDKETGRDDQVRQLDKDHRDGKGPPSVKLGGVFTAEIGPLFHQLRLRQQDQRVAQHQDLEGRKDTRLQIGRAVAHYLTFKLKSVTHLH